MATLTRLERGTLAALDGLARHWLFGLNLAVAVFVGGALLAPTLAALGLDRAASALYAVYHFTCHQWAFRSFFLFGGQLVYDRQLLDGLGVDPFGFVGAPGLGWKLAFCERDLAIYVGLLVVGLLYAGRGRLGPVGFRVYALLIAPMALDGFTQLVGWRESSWQLRVVTGLLFGLASGWLLYPRFDAALRGEPEARHIHSPAESACAPLSPGG